MQHSSNGIVLYIRLHFNKHSQRAIDCRKTAQFAQTLADRPTKVSEPRRFPKNLEYMFFGVFLYYIACLFHVVIVCLSVCRVGACGCQVL